MAWPVNFAPAAWHRLTSDELVAGPIYTFFLWKFNGPCSAQSGERMPLDDDEWDYEDWRTRHRRRYLNRVRDWARFHAE